MMTKPNELRWLCVGTGDLVRKRSAAALAQAAGGKLAAVCGDVERARQIALPLGAEAFGDLDVALRESGANAVYISTPVYRHRDEALKAIDAGLHVLVEKPMALNGEEAAQIANVAKQRGVVAGCAYYRRFFSPYQKLCEMIKNEELGRIVHLRTVNTSWFNPAKDDVKRWRVEKDRSGGGPLADVGSHMLDLIVGLFGQVKSVFAHCDTLVQNYEVEDAATLVMTLRNGAHATAHFGWNTHASCHEFEVVGSEARAQWSSADSGKLVITRGQKVTTLDLPNHDNVHVPLIEDFNDAVTIGRVPYCSAEDAVLTNQLIDAIYLSAAEYRQVML